MQNIGLVSKGPLIANDASNGHMSDDVTWPQTVKVMTPKSFSLHRVNRVITFELSVSEPFELFFIYIISHGTEIAYTGN